MYDRPLTLRVRHWIEDLRALQRRCFIGEGLRRLSIRLELEVFDINERANGPGLAFELPKNVFPPVLLTMITSYSRHSYRP